MSSENSQYPDPGSASQILMSVMVCSSISCGLLPVLRNASPHGHRTALRSPSAPNNRHRSPSEYGARFRISTRILRLGHRHKTDSIQTVEGVPPPNSSRRSHAIIRRTWSPTSRPLESLISGKLVQAKSDNMEPVYFYSQHDESSLRAACSRRNPVTASSEKSLSNAPQPGKEQRNRGGPRGPFTIPR